MRWTPRAMRVGVVLTLMIPTVVIVLGSSVHAQIRQPKQPFPPQPPKQRFPRPIPHPIFENVWTCGACGKVIGKGAAPPGTCPFCGVRIINGVGGAPNVNPNLPPNPNENPDPQTSSHTALLIGLLVVGGFFFTAVLAAVGLGVYFLTRNTNTRKSPRPPRRRLD